MEAKHRVLIVDDNKDLVELMTLALEAEGFECDAAYSAKEGLQQVKERTPDLIVLDVMMEDLTAGFRFLTRVRDRDPNSEFAAAVDTPILMLTGIEDVTRMKFKEKAGTAMLPVDQFVSKPIPPKVLCKKVSEMIKAAAGPT